MSKKVIPLAELGEGVTEGELAKWLVKKGEQVKRDQPLAEIMTDKAVMEVPSPEEGLVEELLAQPGESVQVNAPLLSLRIAPAASVKTSAPIKKVETSEKSKIENSTLALPLTRRLAQKLGVDLSSIKGTGLAGRITKEDVEKKAGVSSTDSIPTKPLDSSRPSAGFSIPFSEGQKRTALKGIRKKIALTMQASHQVIPPFTLLEEADMEQLEEMKNSAREMLEDVKVTYLAFVMKALLQTVKEFPELNAGLDDFKQEIVRKNYYHFGFAVDTARGLLVPVLKDVDKKSLKEISQEIYELADKARLAQIKPEEMKDGTLTITNIGSLGGRSANPIINPPEAVILGMYRLFVKAHWDGEKFIPRKAMNFSLTCDHRLIDGAAAARALQFFVQKIEKPLGLFI